MNPPRPSAGSSRTCKVDYLARVEGEGAVRIRLKGDAVQDVSLRLFEPPRLFEGFLRGRHYLETPDLVARICGICPVAYQMSAVHALERWLDLPVPPATRLLRRLLYCGEWIESHALHVYMLHAPDFLGYPDVLAMAHDYAAVVERGLRLKKAGNTLVAALGGREIHPISVAVGGFHKYPSRGELAALAEELRWARDAALDTARWVAGFEFPDFEPDYEFVALSHPDEYAINEGRVVSSRGLDLDAAEFEEVFVEQQVKHSNALQSRVRQRGAYLVGPLARFNLNFPRLPVTARQAAASCGLAGGCRNPFRGILVRSVELVFACEEALRLIGAYEPPEPGAGMPHDGAGVAPGSGCAATEAPRGLLYHRYRLDGAGLIAEAHIVPPTAQNQKRIEDDLRELVPRLAALPVDQLTARCEQAVRNYDPCISCATHFVRIERGGQGAGDGGQGI